MTADHAVSGPDGLLKLSFRGERMHRVEASAPMPGGNRISTPMGKGRICWYGAPIELADNIEPTVVVYRDALKSAGVSPAVVRRSESEALIYSAAYRDAVLFTIASEGNREQRVVFAHESTGVLVSCGPGSGRAVLALVGRKDRRLIADYPTGAVSVTPIVPGS